jgi:hypothetical protein
MSTLPDSDDASMHDTSIEKAGLKSEYAIQELSALGNNVWRKFDWRILPVAAMFYFLSFLVSAITNPRERASVFRR